MFQKILLQFYSVFELFLTIFFCQYWKPSDSLDSLELLISLSSYISIVPLWMIHLFHKTSIERRSERALIWSESYFEEISLLTTLFRYIFGLKYVFGKMSQIMPLRACLLVKYRCIKSSLEFYRWFSITCIWRFWSFYI